MNKEFFESTEKIIVINARTEAEAIKLCREFDKLEYKWRDGYITGRTGIIKKTLLMIVLV